MQIILLIGGRRYVARPRDHRYGSTCTGCSIAFSSPRDRTCPRDASGNLVCKLGHGWIWRRIPARKRAAEADPHAPEQRMLTLI